MKHGDAVQMRSAKSFALLQATALRAHKLGILPMKKRDITPTIINLMETSMKSVGSYQSECDVEIEVLEMIIRKLALAEVGKTLFQPNVGGFRRNEKGELVVYVNQKEFLDQFPEPTKQRAKRVLNKLKKSKASLLKNEGNPITEYTKTVEQKGIPGKRRYIPLSINELQKLLERLQQ